MINEMISKFSQGFKFMKSTVYPFLPTKCDSCNLPSSKTKYSYYCDLGQTLKLDSAFDLEACGRVTCGESLVGSTLVKAHEGCVFLAASCSMYLGRNTQYAPWSVWLLPRVDFGESLEGRHSSSGASIISNVET